MQLETVALEPLHLNRPVLDRLLALRAYREAEDRQAAILLPELTDAPVDALPSLGKTALGCIGRGRGGQRQQCEDQQSGKASTKTRVHQDLPEGSRARGNTDQLGRPAV